MPYQKDVVKINHSKWLTAALISAALSGALLGCGAGSGEGLDANGNPIQEGGGTNDLFSKVQDQIFTARCIACHQGASAPEGLDLSQGNSYDSIVNVASSQKSNLFRIFPNNPDESYLIQKIRGDSDISGGQMPRDGPPFLTEAEIQLVIDWVEAGAPPVQSASGTDNEEAFIAELSDFVDYKNWTEVDYSIGQTNPALGTAHSATDDNYSRLVYKNSIAINSTGEYTNGSIIVKETITWIDNQKVFSPMGGLLAMVKRGDGFNPDNNGWEWFDLQTELTGIVDHGADLMDGMCNNCHVVANQDSGNGVDYVFKHAQDEFNRSDN